MRLSLRTDTLKSIYSPRETESKGRLISLGDALLTAVFNVFITGIFYTGFLTMYGISVTGVGIVNFIPFLASCFSIFSPSILKHFRRKKPVLLAAKILFYAIFILATTLMPRFVTDPDARLLWLVILLFVAYALWALFSPGFTTWFYHFFPGDMEKRTQYFVYNQVFSSILSSLVLLLSGVITDLVASSGNSGRIILFFRYFAFVLVLVDVFVLSRAAEVPLPENNRQRLREIFTLPLKQRKFLLCMIIMFVWNFNCNLNNGLWAFHLLNHMHFSYTLINLMSVMYTVLFLFTSRIWRRVLRRYSWIRTFGITNLLWVPTEIFFFFMTPERGYLYILLSFCQNILNVGFNLSYANILYMNLPRVDETSYISFSSIGCNLFAFLGLLTGTWIAGLTGENTIPMLGMDVYSLQFTCLGRGLIMGILGFVLTRYWRHFTPDEEVRLLDESNRLRNQKRLKQHPAS